MGAPPLLEVAPGGAVKGRSAQDTHEILALLTNYSATYLRGDFGGGGGGTFGGGGGGTFGGGGGGTFGGGGGGDFGLTQRAAWPGPAACLQTKPGQHC